MLVVDFVIMWQVVTPDIDVDIELDPVLFGHMTFWQQRQCLSSESRPKGALHVSVHHSPSAVSLCPSSLDPQMGHVEETHSLKQSRHTNPQTCEQK